MKKKIISIPPVYLFACLIMQFVVPRLFPVMNLIPFPFTLIGLPFLATGIFFILGAHQSLRKHATPVTFAPSTCLIREGVYRHSRNPMYLGFLALLAGLSIWSGNVLTLFCPVFMFLVLDRMFIPFEEEKMAASFGETYLNYRQSVRRWF